MNTQFKLLAKCIIASLIIMVSQYAFAKTTYYISNSGDNSNNGTTDITIEDNDFNNIKHNYVNKALMLIDDMGGIYTNNNLGGLPTAGTVIEENIVTNCLNY